MVNFVDVESSNVAAVGYDDEGGHLHVKFKNNTEYRYLKVPKEQHDALVGAGSVGSYLNQQIKPSYQCEKLS